VGVHLFEQAIQAILARSLLCIIFVLLEEGNSFMENRMEARAENTMMPRGRRPLGVTIISVLVGIQGILEVIAGIILILAANSLSRTIVSHGHKIISRFVDTFGVGIGVVVLIIGAITLFFVFSLWRLQRWAYWAVIIFEAISLIPHIIALIRGTGTVQGEIIQMILPVIILLYFLVSPGVRRAFRI